MRVAILDDYQGVALACADWSEVRRHGQVDSFADHVSDPDLLVERLTPYDVVVLMRERTPLPAGVIERLPGLRLVVTTGARNAAIDVEAAHRQGVVVSGTGSLATAPAELTWALVLAWARHLPTEVASLRAGGWQSTLGRDLAGRTLGVIGLGRIGKQVATVGRAFGMDVLAWSPRLTAERATAAGATWATLPDLLAAADVVTVHLVLGDRTRGLIGRAELDRMRPDALLVNTSRAPIVDTTALLEALEERRIGGAALDVFDEEPLPAAHPLRRAPGALLTPHLGYVTASVYRRFYAEVVEDILAFAAGSPLRTL